MLVDMYYIYHGSEVYMQNINLQGGSFKKISPKAEGPRVIFFVASDLLVYILHIDQ